MPAARWWAASSTETIPAAPASCRAPSSAAWPALTRPETDPFELPPHYLPPHPALSPDGGEGSRIIRASAISSLSPIGGEGRVRGLRQDEDRVPPDTVLEPDGPRRHADHRRGDRGRRRCLAYGLCLGLDRPA